MDLSTVQGLHTSPRKAATLISGEEYHRQSENPWSVYHFPFIARADVDEGGGPTGRSTDV